jgi:hypothetical protein
MMMLPLMLHCSQLDYPAVMNILDAYHAVLRCGSTYLHHAMPSMINVWLNYTENVCAWELVELQEYLRIL